MTDSPSNLTNEEVENRIGTAMRLVHDLFGQLHTFFSIVREYLSESDVELDTLNSKFYLMPKRKGDPSVITYCKTHLALVAEIGVSAAEDASDDADDADDEGDDDGDETTAQKKKGIELTPESQFLIIKTVLFHPKDTAVRPTVVGAILSSFERRPLKTGKPTKSFKLNRRLLFRLADQVGPGTQADTPLSQRVTRANAVCQVTAVVQRSLASIKSEDDITAFVDKLLSKL